MFRFGSLARPAFLMSCSMGLPPEALTSESVARNRDPILHVLRHVLPRPGTVLEIASGTGEHAVHFAGALPDLEWQPSDRDPDALRSIAAHRAVAALGNLRPPIALDVSRPPWPVLPADAVVTINMIHISPWHATEGLLALSERTLLPGGVLFLYGPYRETGVPLALSNAAFDASLKERDPEWGLRDLGVVRGLAARHGFVLAERIAMPANNLAVVFRRVP